MTPEKSDRTATVRVPHAIRGFNYALIYILEHSNAQTLRCIRGGADVKSEWLWLWL